MNLTNHATFSFLFLVTLLASMSINANASEQIQIHHQLSDHTSLDSVNSVTLSLRINNLSDTDLTNLKIIPTGNEFSVDQKSKTINIGHLPAQSESIIYWTAKTPVAVEYFVSGMPVFFQLSGKQASNANFDLPLYSQGEK